MDLPLMLLGHGMMGFAVAAGLFGTALLRDVLERRRPPRDRR